jgi:hypothetical protein
MGFRRFLLAAFLAAATPAAAAENTVDLALVLAVDVSASVDRGRFELQREGFAAAFSSEAVINAVASGENKAIVVTMVEWSGGSNQKQVIPWTLINDAETSRAFGSAIAEAPRVFSDFTSISGAIDFSVGLFAHCGFEARRRVIDVSGDGSNNSGRSVLEAREEALAQGIVINGLAIIASEPLLERYYRENVIGGEGAFVIAAQDFHAFGNAILNKLVREIAAAPEPAAVSLAALDP